jgi:hypothetical protein
MIESPSPQELAREAREALARNRETSAEHLARLIKSGFLNARGQVTWLLGGDVDPEPPPAGPDEPYVRED